MGYVFNLSFLMIVSDNIDICRWIFANLCRIFYSIKPPISRTRANKRFNIIGVSSMNKKVHIKKWSILRHLRLIKLIKLLSPVIYSVSRFMNMVYSHLWLHEGFFYINWFDKRVNPIIVIGWIANRNLFEIWIKFLTGKNICTFIKFSVERLNGPRVKKLITND